MPASGVPASETVEAGPRPKLRRIRGLDGVRAVAVLFVFGFHADALHLDGGWLGVDLFFSVSGFLITTLLINEYDDRGRVALGSFYLRRARRLFPALALLFGVLIVFFAVHPSIAGRASEQFMPPVLALIPNWWLIAHDPITTPAYGGSVIGHLWTLGVEEQFYVVWPLVLIGLLAVVGNRRAIASLITVTGLCVGAYQVLAWHFGLGSRAAGSQALHDRLFWGSDTHAAGLLLGCAVALHLACARDDSTPSRPRSPGYVFMLRAAGAAAALFLCLVAFGGPSEGWADGGGELGIAVAGALIVWWLAVSPGAWVLAVLEWRPIAYLGRISYGFYLWSLPVIFGVSSLTWRSPALVRAAELVTTFVAAAVSYHLVERPVRRHFGRSTREPGPLLR
jgi:peptidoglycan/LPS O-acetylase OafA/YrhL